MVLISYILFLCSILNMLDLSKMMVSMPTVGPIPMTVHATDMYPSNCK